jgi:hypothetical protein
MIASSLSGNDSPLNRRRNGAVIRLSGGFVEGGRADSGFSRKRRVLNYSARLRPESARKIGISVSVATKQQAAAPMKNQDEKSSGKYKLWTTKSIRGSKPLTKLCPKRATASGF